MKTQPDYRPNTGDIVQKIRSKSSVLYFPIYEELSLLKVKKKEWTSEEPLRIVWPHRWEHDKNPEALYNVLLKLHADGCAFRLSVMGEAYSETPQAITQMKDELHDHIDWFGYAESKAGYYEILAGADVVVSTANHEFFGVAMLEAVFLGCYPLVPNRLVYPEIYPKECLYNTDNQLYSRLKKMSSDPSSVRSNPIYIDFHKFGFQSFTRLFEVNSS